MISVDGDGKITPFSDRGALTWYNKLEDIWVCAVSSGGGYGRLVREIILLLYTRRRLALIEAECAPSSGRSCLP